MVTPAAHREAAAYLQAVHEMSQRWACRVIATDRASVRSRATRPDDGALRDRLKAPAQERRRFGYRRLHVLLRREGQMVNKKRVSEDLPRRASDGAPPWRANGRSARAGR